VAVFRAEVAAPDGSGTRMVFDDGFAEFRWLTGPVSVICVAQRERC
jgi:hypothetical protein